MPTIFRNLLFIAVALGVSAPGEARVYRCTDAAGKVTYSQVPCPTDQQSDTLRLGNKPRQDRDLCRLARELALKSYGDMRSGREPAAVMDDYGGVDYISPATLGVINFAASFRYNDDLSAQRVGALAFARCREGGFGHLREGDLPELEDEAAEPLAAPAADGLPAGQPAQAQAVLPRQRHDPCPDYDAAIERLTAQMQRGNSSERMADLRRQRAEYWAKYSEECRQR